MYNVVRSKTVRRCVIHSWAVQVTSGGHGLERRKSFLLQLRRDAGEFLRRNLRESVADTVRLAIKHLLELGRSSPREPCRPVGPRGSAQLLGSGGQDMERVSRIHPR